MKANHTAIDIKLAKNNTREAFKIIQEITAEWKPKCNIIEDKDGTLLSKPEDVANRWKQYCEELYTHQATKGLFTWRWGNPPRRAIRLFI